MSAHRGKPRAVPWRAGHPRTRGEFEAFLWATLPPGTTYEQVNAILDAADWYADTQAAHGGTGRKKTAT